MLSLLNLATIVGVLNQNNIQKSLDIQVMEIGLK